MKKEEYSSKIKICELLGAKQFKEIVLNFDRVKWKLIKKAIPNYIKYGDKLIDKNTDKKLKKSKTNEESELIKRDAIYNKMLLRKEYNTERNNNYYIASKPTEFLRYLNWNKSVHTRGLIVNSIAIPTLTIGAMHGFKVAVPFVILESLSAIKNFECINLQNYNIYRLKSIEEVLRKKEERTEAANIKKYQSAYNLIADTIKEKQDIIEPEELINNISSVEQLQQLKELLKKEKIIRNSNKNNKSLGGK